MKVTRNDEWFKLLSDEERAAVMKVEISETEATKRKAMEEETRVKIDKDGGYWLIRICIVAGATIFAVGVCMTSCRAVEAWERVRVAPTSVASAPSASSSR